MRGLFCALVVHACVMRCVLRVRLIACVMRRAILERAALVCLLRDVLTGTPPVGQYPVVQSSSEYSYEAIGLSLELPPTSQQKPGLVTTCVGPVGDSEPFCTPTVTVHGFRPGAGRTMSSSSGGVGGAGGESGHTPAGGDGGGVFAFGGGVAAFAFALC